MIVRDPVCRVIILFVRVGEMGYLQGIRRRGGRARGLGGVVVGQVQEDLLQRHLADAVILHLSLRLPVLRGAQGREGVG